MKVFWIIINLFLFILLVGAIGTTTWYFRDQIPKDWLPKIETATTQAQETRKPLPAGQPIQVQLKDAITFRIKNNLEISDEACLVEPGKSFRFTLRPKIDLPPQAPDALRTYLASHPGVEEKIQVDWKADNQGKIVEAGEGRYDFVPPADGKDVTLRFRGRLTLSQKGVIESSLSGETEMKLVCPIAWENIPKEHQEILGQYPTLGKNSQLPRSFYKRPSHFYLVTETNREWKISPSFRLGDFDMHFDYTSPDAPAMNQIPQYIALNQKIIVKLEKIIEGLREVGVQTKSLGILAGFRSPAYNKWKKTQGEVGGKYTKGLSTHMYGAAADFYVDLDGDGKMDDMNGDGVIDMADAAWIREKVVDAIDCQGWDEKNGLAGGCGIYPDHDIPDREIQTPNLHVDVRGYSISRWYVNPQRGDMPTDWKYWEKHPCAGNVQNATDTENLE